MIGSDLDETRVFSSDSIEGRSTPVHPIRRIRPRPSRPVRCERKATHALPAPAKLTQSIPSLAPGARIITGSLTTRRTHHAPYQTDPTAICRDCERQVVRHLGHSLNRPAARAKPTQRQSVGVTSAVAEHNAVTKRTQRQSVGVTSAVARRHHVPRTNLPVGPFRGECPTHSMVGVPRTKPLGEWFSAAGACCLVPERSHWRMVLR